MDIFQGRTESQSQLDAALADFRQKLQVLHEVEMNSARAALIEERARYCLFISAIKPLMVCRLYVQPVQ